MCKKKFGTIIIIFLLMFFIVTISFFFRYKIVYVNGQSMAPNLNDGQVLLAFRNFDDLSYSDVVVVDVPNQGIVIKRVAAISGDTISVSDNKLKINDLTLNNYHIHSDSHNFETYTLSDKELYILGDNYNDSVDSRVYGPVSVDDVLGVIRD